MDALRLVLTDLFQFVFLEWFGWRQVKRAVFPEMPVYEWLKPAIVNPRPLVKLEDVPPKIVPASKPKSSAFVLNQSANIYFLPTLTLDGILIKIPYATKVDIHEAQNRWFKVYYQGISGWMLREDLIEELREPQFKLGNFYGADALETKSVRNIINDEFMGGMANLPLSPEEYIVYRFKQRGVLIPWGKERPRLAGTWQQLLKGRAGCHLGIVPKTDTVMEIITDDNMGHLAYVESVFPDQSILISEVGFPEVSQYSERTLPKSEWIEWRPVFIEIT